MLPSNVMVEEVFLQRGNPNIVLINGLWPFGDIGKLFSVSYQEVVARYIMLLQMFSEDIMRNQYLPLLSKPCVNSCPTITPMAP